MIEQRMSVTMSVNGSPLNVKVAPRKTLADMLRSDLGLTGTHLGCEQGVCGACTVHVDGIPVRSCLMFAYQADGCEVRTVEDLTRNGRLHRLQELFLEKRALQCGFCTPGFLMGLVGLPQDFPREDIREYLAGFVCRCTGYEAIIEAVRAYLDELNGTSDKGD